MDDISSIVSRVVNADYGHSHSVMPEQPWWNHLESSFHKFPDDFELDLRTELTVEGTAWADLLLRTVGAGMLSALALPTSLQPRQLRRDMEQIDFYRRLADKGDPAGFFQRPDSFLVEISSSQAGFFRFRPDDGGLLGAQVVGFDGVDKRIDVLATALRCGLTVYDRGHVGNYRTMVASARQRAVVPLANPAYHDRQRWGPSGTERPCAGCAIFASSTSPRCHRRSGRHHPG